MIILLKIKRERYFSEDLDYFKKKNKVKINLSPDQSLGLQDYNIEFKSKSGKSLEKVDKVENLQKISEEKLNKNIVLTKEKKSSYKRKKFQKRKNFKKKLN